MCTPTLEVDKGIFFICILWSAFLFFLICLCEFIASFHFSLLDGNLISATQLQLSGLLLVLRSEDAQVVTKSFPDEPLSSAPWNPIWGSPTNKNWISSIDFSDQGGRNINQAYPYHVLCDVLERIILRNIFDQWPLIIWFYYCIQWLNSGSSACFQLLFFLIRWLYWLSISITMKLKLGNHELNNSVVI